MISVVTVLSNVALNLWLIRVMGYAGLALGTATASLINASLLLTLLSRRIGAVDAPRVVLPFVKIGLASAAMAAAAWFAQIEPAATIGDVTFVQRALALGGAVAAGILVLAAVAKLLRLSEFEEAMGTVLRRLKGGGAAR